MAHGSDHPHGFVNLLFPAANDHRPLGHDIGTAIGQGDVKGVNAALNAQPFGTGGGQGVRLVGIGLAQGLGPATDACHHAGTGAALDVVIEGLDAAIRVTV